MVTTFDVDAIRRSDPVRAPSPRGFVRGVCHWLGEAMSIEQTSSSTVGTDASLGGGTPGTTVIVSVNAHPAEEVPIGPTARVRGTWSRRTSSVGYV